MTAILDDDVDPLAAPDAVRASRRPGLIALVYVYRTAAAVVLALPLASAVEALVGGHPRADAQLFDPGGIVLLDVVRRLRPAATALGTQALILGVALAFAGLVPLIAWIHALGRRGAIGAADLAAAVGRHLATLTLMLGFATLAQGALSVLVIMLGGNLLAWTGSDRGLAGDVGRTVVVLVALALVALVGVVHDLARVVAVHRDRGLYTATSRALMTFRRLGLRALGAHAWRAALALAAVAGAAALAEVVARRTDGAVAPAVAIHQLGIFVAICLRGSWLAAAIRLTEKAASRERAREVEAGERAAAREEGVAGANAAAMAEEISAVDETEPREPMP